MMAETSPLSDCETSSSSIPTSRRAPSRERAAIATRSLRLANLSTGEARQQAMALHLDTFGPIWTRGRVCAISRPQLE
jgi:hypothetical protein